MIYDQTLVLQLDLNVKADQALAKCRECGLVVQSDGALAARPASHHCHLRIPGPMRDGGWATALAHDLPALPESPLSAIT